MRVSPATAAALLCGLFLLGGCDSAPGPASLEGRPPVLSALTYTPADIILSQLPAGQISGDSARVVLQFAVDVEDPDRDLAEVGYVVQSPAGDHPLAAGTSALPGGAGRRFEGSFDVRVPKDESGTYTLLVYAVDDAGRLSNQVRGQVHVFAVGDPPVVERVEAPDVITRPAQGEPDKVLRIVAIVSDPDGLANIQRVVFWNATTPGQVFDLFDDGDTEVSGDEAAGDGRYTRAIRISSSNQPNTNTFVFQAIDKTGQQSNLVEKQIRVE